MTITELIAQLERVRTERGDLQVMTPGFDESGFDLIADVDVERVVPIERMTHCGDYEAVRHLSQWRKPIGEAFDVVVLRF